MAEQDWRVKTALLKHRVSKFNPNHDPDTGRFSSGPGGGGGAAPRADVGALRRGLDAYDAAVAQAAKEKKEFEVKRKARDKEEAKAAKDPRVKAVRADKVVGAGSQKGLGSITYNAFSDRELLEYLDDIEATTPAKAIKQMRLFEEIKTDQYEDMKGMMDW